MSEMTDAIYILARFGRPGSGRSEKNGGRSSSVQILAKKGRNCQQREAKERWDSERKSRGLPLIGKALA